MSQIQTKRGKYVSGENNIICIFVVYCGLHDGRLRHVEAAGPCTCA